MTAGSCIGDTAGSCIGDTAGSCIGDTAGSCIGDTAGSCNLSRCPSSLLASDSSWWGQRRSEREANHLLSSSAYRMSGSYLKKSCTPSWHGV